MLSSNLNVLLNSTGKHLRKLRGVIALGKCLRTVICSIYVLGHDFDIFEGYFIDLHCLRGSEGSCLNSYVVELKEIIYIDLFHFIQIVELGEEETILLGEALLLEELELLIIEVTIFPQPSKYDIPRSTLHFTFYLALEVSPAPSLLPRQLCDHFLGSLQYYRIGACLQHHLNSLLQSLTISTVSIL